MEDIKKKINEFNKRFNVELETDSVEEFKRFRIRIINKFDGIDRIFDSKSISMFCQILGIEELWEKERRHKRVAYRRISDIEYVHVSKNIINALKGAEDNYKFLLILQAIFYLPFPNYSSGISYKDEYLRYLKDAVELSNINVNIKLEGDEVILYPKGEKSFDERLVNDVIQFLVDKSKIHFIEALNFYLSGKQRSFIKAAESLRRSIEEFLRFKLHNSKGLRENIRELQNKLKEKKKDEFIRQIIYSVFNFMDEYFNENSKHKDGDIDENEIEYLIYQSGVLMRYVNNNL